MVTPAELKLEVFLLSHLIHPLDLNLVDLFAEAVHGLAILLFDLLGVDHGLDLVESVNTLMGHPVIGGLSIVPVVSV